MCIHIMCTYIERERERELYVYMYMCVCVCIYIYIYTRMIDTLSIDNPACVKIRPLARIELIIIIMRNSLGWLRPGWLKIC